MLNQVLEIIEIMVLVSVVFSAGVAVGYRVWGMQLERQRGHYRRRLDDARHNWDAVEAQLSMALDELSAAENALALKDSELEALHQSVSTLSTRRVTA